VWTSWGWMGLAWTSAGLCGVELPGKREDVERRLISRYPVAAWAEVPDFYALPLQRYFAGEPVQFQLPLDFLGRRGFFTKVWDLARSVPFGNVVTYRQLAAMAGNPGAARAVGSAMAANPMPIVIPCHRVVAAGGKLGGYSGGIDWKVRLLALEGSLGLLRP
jgi:methylated-DNA-[protein]-cysteine S-methyltransferase